MALTPIQLQAVSIAQKQGVPPDLFLALIQQESNWNKSARSPVGARGFTQLMPGTAAGLGVNPDDPTQNLLGGARYLKSQLTAFGRPDLALSAYNSGPGGAERHGRVEGFSETQNYVKKVLADRARWQGLLGNLPAGGVAQPAEQGASLPAPTFGSNSEVVGSSPTALTFNPGRAGSDPRRDAILRGLISGQDPNDLIQSLLSLPAGTPARMPTLTQAPVKPAPMPSWGTPAKPGARGFTELIHDPVGSIFDGVRSSKPYGGHGKHLHFASRNPQVMLQALSMAAAMGLTRRENPYVDPVDPVHTKGSHHYQVFPGLFNGKKLGQGVDISGDPNKLRTLFERLAALG